MALPHKLLVYGMCLKEMYKYECSNWLNWCFVAFFVNLLLFLRYYFSCVVSQENIKVKQCGDRVVVLTKEFLHLLVISIVFSIKSFRISLVICCHIG